MQLKNKYLVIINPVSGKKNSKKNLNYIVSFLEKYNLDFDLFISQYKYHIEKHLFSLSPSLYTDIIVYGGDGTFNEVINGILKRQDDYIPRLGLLPGGSGNSVMHDLNAINIDSALQFIINNNVKFIDVMKLEYANQTKYSINIVGWGMVADVAYLAEKLRFLGPSRYTIASLLYIFFSKNRYATLIIDSKKEKNNYLFIMVSNTIYTGKGMKISPNAKLDDGWLDINIVKNNVSKLELLKLLPKIFTGRHINSRYVKYFNGKSIQINFKDKQILNIDGEISNGENIKISILEKKLPIYY